MIPFQDAIRAVLGRAPRLGKERVPLSAAVGRTLFEGIVASHPLPAFAQCTRDGFAIRAEHTLAATGRTPVRLKVAGEASAGRPFSGQLKGERAVRVTTGSVVPDGADAVVGLERVEEHEGAILLTEPVDSWIGVRREGEDVTAGSVVVPAGTPLHPRHLGLLAAFGIIRPRVTRRPHVKILATGTELVDPADEPDEGQIRMSTSFTLEGLIRSAGGTPEICGIVPDKKKQLRKRIKEHLSADIVVTTGGVSSGKHDLIGEVLQDLGADIVVHGVKMRPGSPVLAATLEDTLVFGLPGNPASTVVTFLQLVRPALWSMLGRTETTPGLVRGVMEHEFSKKDDRRQFVFAHCTQRDGQHMVSVRGTQDVGLQSTLAAANCLLVIPEEVTRLMTDDPVELEFLDGSGGCGG